MPVGRPSRSGICLPATRVTESDGDGQNCDGYKMRPLAGILCMLVHDWLIGWLIGSLIHNPTKKTEGHSPEVSAS
jgi:hypothetical protein